MSKETKPLELNKLHHMDCLEGMRQFPEGYFDLAIVDPPYGVGAITYMPHKRTKAVGGYVDEYSIVVAVLDMAQRSNVKNKYCVDVVHGQSGKSTIKNFGDENVAPGPEYFKELFRVSKNQVIWGATTSYCLRLVASSYGTKGFRKTSRWRCANRRGQASTTMQK